MLGWHSSRCGGRFVGCVGVSPCQPGRCCQPGAYSQIDYGKVFSAIFQQYNLVG